MPKIQYSGNIDDPDTFTLKDMEHLIDTYNSTIDAILFIVNYSERSNKSMFDKTIIARDIENLDHYTAYPQNQLISCIGMANDLHVRDGHGPYEAFSSLASLKIRNQASKYEDEYNNISRMASKLHWAFQDAMIFAYDKLRADVKKFKSKYKNLPGLHKIMADVEKHLAITANVIGYPEIEWFDGQITMPHAIAVREKLSANQTPIFPLHMYRDITRFETAMEIVQDTRRERSRKQNYDHAQHEIDTLTDKNIELVQANIALEQANNELNSAKSKLIAENDKMAQQIANIQRSFIGRIMFNWAQRNK